VSEPSDSDTALLAEETAALDETLKAIADGDPAGAPSAEASDVFVRWLAAAGPASRHPEYFTDVAQNYVPSDHTNRDLHDLFTMLAMHVPPPDAGEYEPPQGTFIGLPVITG